MSAHAQAEQKETVPEKLPPLPTCLNYFCLFKNQRRTTKGYFDFSPPSFPQSRTQPTLWNIEVAHQEGAWGRPPALWGALTTFGCAARRGQAASRGRLSVLSYPPAFISPNSSSKLLNHRLTPPDSKAQVNIPLLLKARWLSFISAQNAARRQD